jgi:hypothetical protein
LTYRNAFLSDNLNANRFRSWEERPCDCTQWQPSSGIDAGDAGAGQDTVPSAVLQEILIKTSMLPLNDANLTGNYTVLHAKLAKPFRDQFSPDRLKQR